MYLGLGMSRADCAKFFHVTERTLHNWERGCCAIPYAAYRLLRIHCGYQLPGRWKDWSISGGKLWSPEGHGFAPGEASCWHNLYRRAHLFGVVLKENDELRRGLRTAGGGQGNVPVPPAGGSLRSKGRLRTDSGRSPLDLSKGHISTSHPTNPAFMRPATWLDTPCIWSVSTNKKGGQS